MNRMKQNITLKLDKKVLQQARVLAAQRSTSISQMLSDELTRLVKQAEVYESARRAALADLERGFSLGGQRIPRDELHER